MSVDLTLLFGPQGFNTHNPPMGDHVEPGTPTTMQHSQPATARTQPVAAPIPPQQHEFTPPPEPAHPSASVVMPVPLQGTVTGTVEVPVMERAPFEIPWSTPVEQLYDPNFNANVDHLGRPLPRHIKRDLYNHYYNMNEENVLKQIVEFESWLAPIETPGVKRKPGRPPKYQRLPNETDKEYAARSKMLRNKTYYQKRAHTTIIAIPPIRYDGIELHHSDSQVLNNTRSQYLLKVNEFEKWLGEVKTYIEKVSAELELYHAAILSLKNQQK